MNIMTTPPILPIFPQLNQDITVAHVNHQHLLPKFTQLCHRSVIIITPREIRGGEGQDDCVCACVRPWRWRRWHR